jgi:hypothetical protein
MKTARNVLLEHTRAPVLMSVSPALTSCFLRRAAVTFPTVYVSKVISENYVGLALLELTKISSGLTTAYNVQKGQSPWLRALPPPIASAEGDTHHLVMVQPAKRAQQEPTRLGQVTCRAQDVVLVRIPMALRDNIWGRRVLHVQQTLFPLPLAQLLRNAFATWATRSGLERSARRAQLAHTKRFRAIKRARSVSQGSIRVCMVKLSACSALQTPSLLPEAQRPPSALASKVSRPRE